MKMSPPPHSGHCLRRAREISMRKRALPLGGKLRGNRVAVSTFSIDVAGDGKMRILPKTKTLVPNTTPFGNECRKWTRKRFRSLDLIGCAGRRTLNDADAAFARSGDSKST